MSFVARGTEAHFSAYPSTELSFLSKSVVLLRHECLIEFWPQRWCRDWCGGWESWIPGFLLWQATQFCMGSILWPHNPRCLGRLLRNFQSSERFALHLSAHGLPK